MASNNKKKHARVLAVLNMKGGVGKTTITGNVFREIFRGHRQKILLIDFDAQFNLTQLLLTRDAYDKAVADKRTILSILVPENPESIFAVADDYHLEIPSADSVIVGLKYLTDAPNIQLNLLPGNFELAMLNLKEPDRLRLPRARFKKLIGSVRNQYDLIVIDCNPSSSFVTRSAVEEATDLLVPVRADKYSLLGVEMVHRYIKQLRPTDPPRMHIILNDVKDEGDSLAVAQKLRGHADFGPLVLVNELRHTTLLQAKHDYTGFAVDRLVPYRQATKSMLDRVAKEIATKLELVNGK